eukprot:c32736_g1_i1 orf=58-288(+)
MGEFNMVEQNSDKQGGSNSTIQGAEREAWNQLKWKTRLDMTDSEPRMMTWSNCRIEGRIEARLDRIYASEGGSWLG